jgi:DNA-binding NtrC family response regulator
VEEYEMNIILIDDLMKATDPLVVQLKLTFKDANIILKDNAKDGLEYIINNINSKMIVLLDYDLGAGRTGTEVLKKLRKKTALLYVIIITAKLIDDIPNKELVTYINENAFAFVDKTVSIQDRINIIKNATHTLDVRVDCVLEQWINRHTEEEQNEPYLTTISGKIYTLKSLLEEIRQQTEFGKTIERKILMLAVDLLTRGKEQIND